MAELRSYSLGKLMTAYPNFYQVEDTATRTYEVQGKKATSYEYNVALGLEQLGYEYTFQVNIFGGRMELGGIVLDFLVDTPPLLTPLWVNEEYFHSGADMEKDLLQQAQVEAEMGDQLNPAIVLWGWQTETPENALMWLRIYL